MGGGTRWAERHRSSPESLPVSSARTSESWASTLASEMSALRLRRRRRRRDPAASARRLPRRHYRGLHCLRFRRRTRRFQWPPPPVVPPATPRSRPGTTRSHPTASTAPTAGTTRIRRGSPAGAILGSHPRPHLLSSTARSGRRRGDVFKIKPDQPRRAHDEEASDRRIRLLKRRATTCDSRYDWPPRPADRPCRQTSLPIDWDHTGSRDPGDPRDEARWG